MFVNESISPAGVALLLNSPRLRFQMEDDGWQTIGTTLNGEYPDTIHIRPGLSTGLRAPSTSRQRTSSLPSNNGRQTSIHQEPLGRRSATFKRTSHAQQPHRGTQTDDLESLASTPSLRRQNAVKLTPVQKVRRFFRRFTWWSRVRRYRFGKRYLRRQSSYVVTPDQSTSNFRFRTKDLISKHPRPDSWRSSRPVQAWKATDPMAALSGKINLPTQTRSRDARRSQPPTAPTPVVPSAEFAGRHKHVRHQVKSGVSVDPSVILDRNDTRQSWVKVSLPVRKPVVQSQLPHKPSHTSLATTEEGQGLAGDVPQTPTRDNEARLNQSPIQNIAPTPTTTRSRGEDPMHTTSGDSLPLDTMAAEATIASLTMTPPRPGSRSPEAVTHQGDAQSPTSAKAQFRPASWRKSAVLPRQLTRRTSSRRSRSSRRHADTPVIISDDLDMELDEVMEFVGAWSAYLRRAVAVRAIIHREEKAWEDEKEYKWATSSYADSNDYYPSSDYEGSAASIVGDTESSDSIRRTASDVLEPSGSDAESVISSAEAQFNSEDDDTSPEFDPEEDYIEQYSQQLPSRIHTSSEDVSSSSNNLDNMTHRYSALFNTSSSDKDAVYNTASESSFPGLASAWKIEEQPELPDVPPPGVIAPVTALRVAKSPANLGSPSTSLTVDTTPTLPTDMTPSNKPGSSNESTTPARSTHLSDHKRLESFDFSSPSTSGSKPSRSPGAPNEKGAKLFQDYYRGRRGHHSSKGSLGHSLSNIDDNAAEGEEYRLQQESLVIRQNTLRSNWGAAASDDGSSDSASSHSSHA